MSFQSRQKKRLAAYAPERYGVVGHACPTNPSPRRFTTATASGPSATSRSAGSSGGQTSGTWAARNPGPNDAGEPTGHLTSPQVGGVNHLEPARLDV